MQVSWWLVPVPAPAPAALFWSWPKDAPILATAVAARPDRFLTLDVTDFIEPTHIAEKRGLRIETPAEFVQAIRALVAEELKE